MFGPPGPLSPGGRVAAIIGAVMATVSAHLIAGLLVFAWISRDGPHGYAMIFSIFFAILLTPVALIGLVTFVAGLSTAYRRRNGGAPPPAR
ncbi:hypothetical protein [Naumannella cuiyingiana]|uniref:ABC-type tungstate transport system substrate-binding protein n=1 Tax=Naumannella cuiyingiana TaxID=1347891 RepID=A0A7Z0IK92_9ACTN|nr:hypothetical protein [Naumannella cuiyingiana]NYI70340.1 ABC-type tungstate transport system substrate-binding protein [Naumannella cuiyingiana]